MAKGPRDVRELLRYAHVGTLCELDSPNISKLVFLDTKAIGIASGHRPEILVEHNQLIKDQLEFTL